MLGASSQSAAPLHLSPSLAQRRQRPPARAIDDDARAFGGLCVLLAWGFGKAKSGEHPAFALHLLYWHLPAQISGLKRTPPSHERDLLG